MPATGGIWFKDTFTDTNGTLLSTHVPDIDFYGTGYTNAPTDFEIINGAAKKVAGQEASGGIADTIGASSDLEQLISLNVSGPAGTYAQGVDDVKIYVSKSVGGNYFRVQLQYVNATSIQVIVIQADTTNGWSVLNAGTLHTVTTSLSYAVDVEVSGGFVKVYIDSTQATNDSILAGFPTAAGSVAFTVLGGNYSVDNFQAQNWTQALEAPVTSPVTIPWSIIASVDAPVTIPWTILSNIQSIDSPITIPWSLIGTVRSDLTIPWTLGSGGILLSVAFFDAGGTVSYKLVDYAGTIVQDWTTIGVVEYQPDTNLPISEYRVIPVIPASFQGTIFWRGPKSGITTLAYEGLNAYNTLQPSIKAVTDAMTITAGRVMATLAGETVASTPLLSGIFGVGSTTSSYVVNAVLGVDTYKGIIH